MFRSGAFLGARPRLRRAQALSTGGEMVSLLDVQDRPQTHHLPELPFGEFSFCVGHQIEEGEEFLFGHVRGKTSVQIAPNPVELLFERPLGAVLFHDRVFQKVQLLIGRLEFLAKALNELLDLLFAAWRPGRRSRMGAPRQNSDQGESGR
ncbi:MAG: hypothetical protein A2X94_17630 [Bdellovibrionales bacterium GWB1_55_8]|nr:MAG: hypothetical protein A2X94_17630 [Bdellovibrionales bacterium GWB1_55_8]